MDNYQTNKYKWQKLTNQRTLILEFIQSSKNYPTAEEIYNSLKLTLPRLSLSTIYRNLKSLESENVIISIKTPDKKIRYQIKGADIARFYCTNCRKLSEIPLAEIIDIKRRLETRGLKISKTNFIFEGLCERCQELF